jgi:hypothetical protein
MPLFQPSTAAIRHFGSIAPRRRVGRDRGNLSTATVGDAHGGATTKARDSQSQSARFGTIWDVEPRRAGMSAAPAPILLRRMRISTRARPICVALAIALVTPLLFTCASAGAKARPLATGSKTGAGVPKPPLSILGKSAADWSLVFDTEFTQSGLNTGIWRPGWFGTGITGPINVHELACYSSAQAGLAVPGPLDLSLTNTPSTCDGVQRPYTGAVVSTNPYDGRADGGFQYRYGLLQARIYVPPYQGKLLANWPAVMTLGQEWPQDGEDDLLEGLGGTACFHFHSPQFVDEGLGGCDRALAPGWHTVSAYWQPGNVTWYYDGVEVGEASDVTSAPMYIVLANTVNEKSASVARPATMKVSWVRIWQPAGAHAARAGYMYSY